MTSFPLEADQYKLLRQIGKGTYSQVYEAQCLANNVIVAMKLIDLEECPLPLDSIQKQTALWSNCEHPNILKYYGSFVSGHVVWIITEFMAAGSLDDVLKYGYSRGLRDEGIISYIIRCILNALQYFHSTHGIHRNFRSCNILISEEGIPKISDFGLATSLIRGGHRLSAAFSVFGDACYLPPEILMNKEGFSPKADIWALGLSTIEMATGKMPYSGMKLMESISKIITTDPPSLPESGGFSSVFKDFVKQCFIIDPSKRASANDLLQHKFIKGTKDAASSLSVIVTSLPHLAERFEISYGKSVAAKQDQKPAAPVDFDFGEKPEEKPIEKQPEKPEEKNIEKQPEKELKGRFTVTRQARQEPTKQQRLQEELIMLQAEIEKLEKENDTLQNQLTQVVSMVRQNKAQ